MLALARRKPPFRPDSIGYCGLPRRVLSLCSCGGIDESQYSTYPLAGWVPSAGSSLFLPHPEVRRRVCAYHKRKPRFGC